MAIGLGQYLAVAAILFTIGVLGIFLNRKNVIIILMSIELILPSNSFHSCVTSPPHKPGPDGCHSPAI